MRYASHVGCHLENGGHFENNVYYWYVFPVGFQILNIKVFEFQS
jgi:hypothetical protein